MSETLTLGQLERQDIQHNSQAIKKSLRTVILASVPSCRASHITSLTEQAQCRESPLEKLRLRNKIYCLNMDETASNTVKMAHLKIVVQQYKLELLRFWYIRP